MDPSRAGSRKRTVGPGEIIETGLLGNRSRGPQLRCWTDDIIEWTGLAINKAAGSTQDRDRWRGILCAASYINCLPGTQLVLKARWPSCQPINSIKALKTQ